jgi:hypothetical protein
MCPEVQPEPGERLTGPIMGAVMLRPACDGVDAEAVLKTIGVYAPRGLDSIVWLDERTAEIEDAGGNKIVRIDRDDVTREQRLAHAVDLYPPDDGQDDTMPYHRFLLVRTSEGGGYAHETFACHHDAAEDCMQNNARTYDVPHMLIDLDTGDQWDPVMSYSFEPRVTTLAEEIEELHRDTVRAPAPQGDPHADR